jgi:hypothetical protein
MRFLVLQVVMLVLLSVTLGHAHRAPSGWAYDGDCCSNMDCGVIEGGRLRRVEGGWEVDLRPGDTPRVSRAGRGFISESAIRGAPPRSAIRPSGDLSAHVCAAFDGTMEVPIVFCLYLAPAGG